MLYNNLLKTLCNKKQIEKQIGGSKKKSQKNIKKDDSSESESNNDIKYDEDKLIKLLSDKNWEKIVELFKNPRDVKINGNNLLHLACSRGEANAINYYLLKYPELFYVANSDGDSCGHLLAKYGHYDLLKKLLPKFPEVIHFLNKDGSNLLDLTIKEPQIMSWIMNLIDPEYFKEMDASKIASLKSMIELIKLNNGKDLYLQLINKLINKGYDVTLPQIYYPLIGAAKFNKPDIIKLLIKKGVDPNIKDVNDLTPLIRAIQNNSYEAVNKLLKYGADINYAGPEGDHFPINIAIQNKDSKMLNLLLTNKYSKNKINFDFKDRNLNTPLHIVLENNLNNDIISPSNLFKFIYESDINSKNLKNNTPLHYLARNSKNINLALFSNILKKKNINLNIKDYKNKTPLDYLSKNEKKIFSGFLENNLTNQNTNESEINMPEIKNTNFGLFNSDVLHNVIYTIMILRKYKNLSIPKQKLDIKKQNIEINNFNYLSNYKSSEGKLIKDIINIYLENFYEIIPYLILWKSNELHFYYDGLQKSIKEELKNKSKRFIFIKLSLIPNSSGTHANILIYDKKLNILERFEPYGPNGMLDEEKLNIYLEILSKNLFNKKTKFISPKLFLDDTKFQIVSSDSDPDNKKLGDPIGYCLAWCFWYLELRLKNPNVPAKELVKFAFNEILQKHDKDSNQVLSYIRNYSQELDVMKNKFLKEAGIPETDFYNTNFTNNQLELIINNFSKEF